MFFCDGSTELFPSSSARGTWCQLLSTVGCSETHHQSWHKSFLLHNFSLFFIDFIILILVTACFVFSVALLLGTNYFWLAFIQSGFSNWKKMFETDLKGNKLFVSHYVVGILQKTTKNIGDMKIGDMLYSSKDNKENWWRAIFLQLSWKRTRKKTGST